MTTDRQTFADTLLACEECGVEFIWTVTQQRKLAEQGAPLKPPTTCPACQRLVAPPDRRRGRVKWYNRLKGWGFITQTNGEEIFVHHSGLAEGLDSLYDGDLVEFAVEQTPKGPQAVDARPLPIDDEPPDTAPHPAESL